MPHTRKSIEDMCRGIHKEIEKNGCLDHVIDAVQNRVIESRKNSKNPNKYFRILKKQSKELPDGCFGYVWISNLNATVYYHWTFDEPERVCALKKQLTVAHELGHIMLHLSKEIQAGECVNTIAPPAGDIGETEADYFSESIVTERSDLYGDAEFIARHRFNGTEIKAALNLIHPEYDPEELP
ncbi:hypothetical protein FACS1894188_03210 [Clostridia bacterium]|nr:hypothetical protein FACS1894188_03210 [Clostridia bacterium]